MIKRAIAVLIMTTASVCSATTIYWEGEVDNLYTNGANWSTGNVPANTDYTDKIYFNDSHLSGIMTKTCQLTGDRQINAIVFQDAGYSITGSRILTKYFTSSGEGTNTLNALKIQQSSYTWTIGVSNVVIVGSLYQDGSNKKITFQGGGTFIVDDPDIDGWASINYQQLNDITLIIAGSNVYNKDKNYITKLTQDASELQLKTTVVGAQSLIDSGKIVEDLDRGLSVKDIGGGYVSIMLAPEVQDGTVILIN